MVSVYFRIENITIKLKNVWCHYSFLEHENSILLLNYIYLWPAGEHCLYTCVDNVYTKMRVRAYVVDVQNKEIVSQNDQ